MAPPAVTGYRNSHIFYGSPVGDNGETPFPQYRIIPAGDNDPSRRYQVFRSPNTSEAVLVQIPDKMAISQGRIQDPKINAPYHAWLKQQEQMLNGK